MSDSKIRFRPVVKKPIGLWLLPAIIFISQSLFAEHATSEKVIYCVDPNWLPYEALVDGKHIGISSDYLEIFSQAINIDFELLPTSTWDESIDLLTSGECHATLILNHTESRDKYLKFSDVYLRSPNILISRTDQPLVQGLAQLGDRTLAVVKNYRLVEYINAFYPEANIILVDSEKEGMQAVSDGDVDVFVGSMLSLNARIQQHGFDNLKVSGWIGPQDELRVGVIHSKAHILEPINRAIAAVTEADRIRITSKWAHTRIIDETDYSTLYKLILVLGVIILFFILRQFQMKKFQRTLSEKNAALEKLHRDLELANHELKELSFNDSLTGLYNRRYFNTSIRNTIEHLHRNFSPCCLMLVDLDHFKRLNDQFGHAAGDQALKEISQLFHTVMRRADLIARWGGEEFIFLLPDTTPKEGTQLAVRLLESVRSHDFSGAGKLTISIGLSEFREKETFDSWFNRTDEALYLAKANGRDQLQSL